MIECQKCGSIEPDRVRPNRILYRLAKAFCYCLYSVQMPGGQRLLLIRRQGARTQHPSQLPVNSHGTERRFCIAWSESNEAQHES